MNEEKNDGQKITALREAAGMSKKAFAEYFNIPYRTVQDWEYNKRVPRDYIIDLFRYKLERENIIKSAEEETE